MKYLKIFEEFHKDELNEEISLKPIVPLISSLFISLNSLAGVLQFLYLHFIIIYIKIFVLSIIEFF